MLVGLGPIGPIEALVILGVVILIFGVGKMGDVGGALGKSIREFRKAAREPDEDEVASAAQEVNCKKCGALVGSGLKFCGECGEPVQARVS